MIKMVKKIDGQELMREFPSRNLSRLIKSGWKKWKEPKKETRQK